MKVQIVGHLDNILNPIMPQPPRVEDQFDTIEDAIATFRERIAAFRRDGWAPLCGTDAGGPWADVYPLGAWDGTGYDDTLMGQIRIGPRGRFYFRRA